MQNFSRPRSVEFWVLLSTILASSMAFIDGSALNVALPSLQTDLKMDGTQLTWVVNAYALFLSALILVGGSLGDHYGRKRVFMLGIALFAIASLACGLAANSGILIAARAVQGVGGAFMVPGSLAILSSTFSEERRGQAIGTWSTFSTLTTLLGPIVGGVLAGAGLWRAIFFINLPLALLALWVLRTHVPESRDAEAPKQLDWLGAGLVTLGLAGLTFGFTESPTYGLTHPLIMGILVGSIVALLLFVVVEARSDHPMIPLGLFRSRTFSGTNALTLFLYGALGSMPFFLSLNLVQVQGYPQAQAGLVMLPLGIILALMSRRMGALADRIGARPLLTIGPALAGVGFALFAVPGVTGGPADYWGTYFPAVLLLAIGMGITVAPLTTAVMGAAPAHSSGTASGINNAVARTAGVLILAMLGAVVLVRFSSNLETRIAGLNLSEATRTEIVGNAPQLAAAEVPAQVAAEQGVVLRQVIQESYVETFRLVALVAAGLAWLSAGLAWLLVDTKQRAVSSPG